MDTIKVLDKHIAIRQTIFAVAVLLCLTPLVSPPVALLLGLVIALFVGHPLLHLNHKATQILLQVSVVGLGFGMNAASALRAGKEGFLFTVVSITGTLTAGLLLGWWMKIDRKTSLLISGGTAICGGSAIAALSPVIGAGERQVSVAMGAVFILNSVALFLFPAVGHLLHLSQTQFGLWSAIAIHDTSSVVGAAGKYGPEALQIATTVKLARALWIIPVSLLAAFFFRGRRGQAIDAAAYGAAGHAANGTAGYAADKAIGYAADKAIGYAADEATGYAADKATIKGAGKTKIKIPWFIGFFILAILFNTWVPVPALSHVFVGAAHAGLTLTLFLIGSGLSQQVLINTGVKPLLQGLIVWMLIGGGTLWAVLVLVR
jgi:uncharacterized membrane protein YadS